MCIRDSGIAVLDLETGRIIDYERIWDGFVMCAETVLEIEDV